jgi:hypothetical protein
MKLARSVVLCTYGRSRSPEFQQDRWGEFWRQLARTGSRIGDPRLASDPVEDHHRGGRCSRRRDGKEVRWATFVYAGKRNAPLEPVDTPGVEFLEGVRFPMKSGGRTVSVLVTRDALQEIERPPPEEGEYMARFVAFRTEIEAIASSKFDSDPSGKAGVDGMT